MPEDYCPECSVSMDLHDGPNTCHVAERKAEQIEAFISLTFR